ncbi:hypothetical protein [Microbacterium sp. NPDC055683]
MLLILAVGFIALFLLLQYGCLLLASAGFSIAGVLSRVVASAYFAVIVWIAVAMFLTLGGGGASKSLSAVGEETPPGEHWVVESLAARTAADGAAAFRLAVRTLRGLPSGRVLVAVARTPELQAGYVRLGFTPGDKLRVHRVL